MVVLQRILFVLPKLGQNWSKNWKKLSLEQKDQRRRCVWLGQADFSKIAKRKHLSSA